MKVNKILWPTDFSSNAEKALPYVNVSEPKEKNPTNAASNMTRRFMCCM